MLVDEYDQYPNEKTTDVVVSSPGSDEPTPPSASDRTFLSNPSSPSMGSIEETKPQPQLNPQSRPVGSCRDATDDCSSGRLHPPHNQLACLVPALDIENVADTSLFGLSDEAMMARVLPKNPDLETEGETYNTWHIQDWRKQERKIHGPAFKCGGSPW